MPFGRESSTGGLFCGKTIEEIAERVEVERMEENECVSMRKTGGLGKSAAGKTSIENMQQKKRFRSI